MERIYTVTVPYRGSVVVLKVPELLRIDIKMHAENRKVPMCQVYEEALNGTGAYTQQIAECEREK